MRFLRAGGYCVLCRQIKKKPSVGDFHCTLFWFNGIIAMD